MRCDQKLSVTARHDDSISQINNTTILYQSFTGDDFNKTILYVKVARQFLSQKGSGPNRIAIVGASISANIALNYAALDPMINTLIFMPPGLNYRGISTSYSIDLLRNYKRKSL